MPLARGRTRLAKASKHRPLPALRGPLHMLVWCVPGAVPSGRALRECRGPQVRTRVPASERPREMHRASDLTVTDPSRPFPGGPQIAAPSSPSLMTASRAKESNMLLLLHVPGARPGTSPVRLSQPGSPARPCCFISYRERAVDASSTKTLHSTSTHDRMQRGGWIWTWQFCFGGI